jgi:hypothetical protein
VVDSSFVVVFCDERLFVSLSMMMMMSVCTNNNLVCLFLLSYS